MSIKDAYNLWAGQYDRNNNKTRDLEKTALQESLSALHFNSCLEVGCGTGKNSVWLIERVEKLTAVDLSEEMLKRAKEKVTSGKADFLQADITQPWLFLGDSKYDLVSFSLVLEHIADLDHVFKEASRALHPGGHLYLGELHPFKQYTGTKARFDTDEGRHVVACYNHHVSDFIAAGKKQGLSLTGLNEYFDNGNRDTIPRILSAVFSKPPL